MNLHDIARLAETSKSTVSRVLNGDPKVSENVRERVMMVVEETGYRRNAAARGLRGSGQAIAVVCWHLEGHFTASLLSGITKMLEGRDEIMITSFPRGIDSFRHAAQSLLAQPMVQAGDGGSPGVTNAPLKTEKPVLICQGRGAPPWVGTFPL